MFYVHNEKCNMETNAKLKVTLRRYVMRCMQRPPLSRYA